jgi:hypothetical protein
MTKTVPHAHLVASWQAPPSPANDNGERLRSPSAASRQGAVRQPQLHVELARHLTGRLLASAAVIDCDQLQPCGVPLALLPRGSTPSVK